MNKTILWDFDGTLSYPNKSFFTALYTAVSESGYEIEKEKTEEFLQKAYSWKKYDIIYPDKTGEKWWDTLFDEMNAFLHENGVSETDFEKIDSRFKEALIDFENYRLYDDAIETLEKCKELGYKNYIASNNYPEIIKIFENIGIAPYMEEYFISSYMGYEKPRAEFYNYAKEVAGNPDVLYMIGDNPAADIKGGKDAGCIAVAVHECRESEADYYFEKLTDIVKILK